MRAVRILPALFSVLLLASCVGISAEVEVRADGSGTLGLEYRVSRLVEAMGKTAGAPLLPFPIGRAEFERFLSASSGIALASYESRSDETDLNSKASLSFADIGALSRFLESTGRRASVSENGGRRTLNLRISEGGGPLDPELKRLVDSVFKGYSLSLRFRFPSVPTVAGGGSADAAARTALYSAQIADILSSEKPIEWSITW